MGMIPFSFVTLGAFIGGLGLLMTARDRMGRSKPISGPGMLLLSCSVRFAMLLALCGMTGTPNGVDGVFNLCYQPHIPPFLLLFSLRISCKKGEGRTENGTNE
jgi:hypothetical protein